MDMPIEIVPAIRSIEVEHVGCWTSLRLEFIPGLNIITEEAGGLGKSTILWAIVRAIHPSSDLGILSPTKGFGEGRISVEFMSRGVSARVDRQKGAPPTSDRTESTGETMLRMLRYHLEMAEEGTAVLFDDEALAVLGNPCFSQAVDLLNTSHKQIICVTAHRLNPADFPKARIYACSWGQDRDTAHMRLQQSGGADG